MLDDLNGSTCVQEPGILIEREQWRPTTHRRYAGDTEAGCWLSFDIDVLTGLFHELGHPASTEVLVVPDGEVRPTIGRIINISELQPHVVDGVHERWLESVVGRARWADLNVQGRNDGVPVESEAPVHPVVPRDQGLTTGRDHLVKPRPRTGSQPGVHRIGRNSIGLSGSGRVRHHIDRDNHRGARVDVGSQPGYVHSDAYGVEAPLGDIGELGQAGRRRDGRVRGDGRDNAHTTSLQLPKVL